MLFAHLKRILQLGRLRLRGPRGAQFEFTLAAIAQKSETPRHADRASTGQYGNVLPKRPTRRRFPPS
jgi:hypothetical protein